MRLLSVVINGTYKGLSNQVFDFSQCSGNVWALVGLNGSGKSQLLELIAETFAHLERAQRADFRVREHFLFTVILEYRIRPYVDAEEEERLRVEVNKNGAVLCDSFLGGKEWVSIDLGDLNLPQHVVGYSSGLNENLQRSFMKNALQFYQVMTVRSARRKRLAGDLPPEDVAQINQYYLQRYPGIFSDSGYKDEFGSDYLNIREKDTKVPAMIFLDYDCNALLMASLSILPPEEMDLLFPEVVYRYPRKVVIRYDLRKMAIEEDAIQDINQLIRAVGIGGVSGISAKTKDDEYEIYELDYLAADITLDFSNAQLREFLSKEYYGIPLRLFERLYKIQLLGVGAWKFEDRKRLSKDAFLENVKKPLKTKLPLSVVQLQLSNDQGQVIEFDDLSDGEAQLIQVVGGSRVFREDNTLYLLDEPETHLNPSWRTYFHQHLTNALGWGDKSNRRTQVLLSTHSPFLVSSLQQEDVLQFERDVDGNISMEPVATQTYGASFEVLIKRFFGLNSLISQTAVDEIKKYIAAGDNKKAKEWIEGNLGDSMERAYLLRKLDS